MRRFWHPVARSEDLPAGTAKPIRIMSEDFTLYRGAGGAAHLTAFRCAHRGTQLSTGWVEEDNIRCFYHGWVYDASGQCIDQPAEKDESFAAKIKIRSYPAEDYLGLVFAYLGEGDAPHCLAIQTGSKQGNSASEPTYASATGTSTWRTTPTPAISPSSTTHAGQEAGGSPRPWPR